MTMEQFSIKSLDDSALSLMNSLTRLFPWSRGCATSRWNTKQHKTYIHIGMVSRSLFTSCLPHKVVLHPTHTNAYGTALEFLLTSILIYGIKFVTELGHIYLYLYIKYIPSWLKTLHQKTRMHHPSPSSSSFSPFSSFSTRQMTT